MDLKKTLNEMRHDQKHLKVDLEDMAFARLEAKKVEKLKLVSAMDDCKEFSLDGIGFVETSKVRTHAGTASVKMTCPNVTPTMQTLQPVPFASENKAAYTRLLYRVCDEDWSEYNRITFWVYPDCPGMQSVGMDVVLCNDGVESRHFIHLTNHKWNLAIWEFPEIARNKVEKILIGVRVTGALQNMAAASEFYFSKLQLEKVSADYLEGWELQDRIAYCHSGYAIGAQKLAFISDTDAKEFSVIDQSSKEIVYTGELQKADSEVGDFYRLDFSVLDREGEYVLSVDGRTTEPFCICKAPWDSVIWKTLQYFYEKRCGCDVPDVHIPCHADCFTVHPDGRKAFVTGGWHDKGDLSHDLCGTAEAVKALMALAQSVKNSNTLMYDRLIEEARNGLEWMQYTRFGDGYRCVEHCLDVWTGGVIGDSDDVNHPAHNDPYANFCAASASAVAARLYENEDRVFALYCLNCAKADFQFAYEHMNVRWDAYGIKDIMPEMQLNAQAMVAAVELYKSTNDKEYLEKAVRFAKLVLSCQQTEQAEWTGFFYDSAKKVNPAGGDADIAAVMGLALLAEYAPSHPECEKWLGALAAYAGYLKAMANLTKPYSVFSAALSDKGVERFVGEDLFKNMLAMAKKASVLASVLEDDCLKNLAVRQIEWLLGSNPFARSFVYGEGHGYLPLFNEFSKDAAGAIPTGLCPSENGMPSLCMTNSEKYSKSELAPSSRLLWTIADM